MCCVWRFALGPDRSGVDWPTIPLRLQQKWHPARSSEKDFRRFSLICCWALFEHCMMMLKLRLKSDATEFPQSCAQQRHWRDFFTPFFLVCSIIHNNDNYDDDDNNDNNTIWLSMLVICKLVAPHVTQDPCSSSWVQKVGDPCAGASSNWAFWRHFWHSTAATLFFWVKPPRSRTRRDNWYSLQLIIN